MKIDDPRVSVEMKLHCLKMMARDIIKVVEALEKEVA